MRRRSEGNFSGLELGTLPTYFTRRCVVFCNIGVVSVQPYCFLGFLVAMMVKKGLGSASLSHAHSTAGPGGARSDSLRAFAQGGRSIRVCHTRLRFLSSRWLLACLSLGDEGPGTAATPYASTARSRHPLTTLAACTTQHTHARTSPPLLCPSGAGRGCSVVSGGRHVHGRAGVGRRRVYSSLAWLGCGRGGHRPLARRDRSDIRIRGGRRRAGWRRGWRRWHRKDEALGRLDSQAGRLVGEDRRQAAACGATVRGTCGTPEAGTRMAHVQ